MGRMDNKVAFVVGARRNEELTSLVAEIQAAGGEAVGLAGAVRLEAYAKALAASNLLSKVPLL